MSRYLDPKADVVFKKIFGSNPNRLKSFLNAVLPLPNDRLIESLTYLSSEQVPVLPALKHPIVDVKCKDSKGRSFIVEMQIQWVSAFMQRILFNTSAAYVHQLTKGEAYTSLSPVYGLAILAHSLLDNTTEWFHHYKMTNVNDSDKSLDDIQIVLVELSKFKPLSIKDKKLTVLWLRFLSEIGENTVHVAPDLLAVPEIKEAIDLSEESAYTPGELSAYHTYWDSVSSEKTLVQGKYLEGEAAGIAKGEAIGMARGEAIGMAKGEAIGIAKGLRQMYAAGLSLEQIAEISKLSLEAVRKLVDSPIDD